jgi:hypothetical protein
MNASTISAMGKQDEFIKQVQTVLQARCGTIAASSVIKNNLPKLMKEVGSITKEDGQVLIENITKAVSLFQTKDEVYQIKEALGKILPMLM